MNFTAACLLIPTHARLIYKREQSRGLSSAPCLLLPARCLFTGFTLTDVTANASLQLTQTPLNIDRPQAGDWVRVGTGPLREITRRIIRLDIDDGYGNGIRKWATSHK